MKKHVLSLLAAATVVAGVSFIGLSDVGAWKCQYHPEKPNCTPTTTTPANTTIVQTTTTVPDTIVSIPTTVPETTTTTTTTIPEYNPPEVSLNPPSIERPPALSIKLAG